MSRTFGIVNIIAFLSYLFTACTGSSTTTHTTLLIFSSEGKGQLPPGENYQSPVFKLGTAPARLVYEYESSQPEIGGVFAVFIVPKGGSSANGDGFPQLMTHAVRRAWTLLSRGNGLRHLEHNGTNRVAFS